MLFYEIRNGYRLNLIVAGGYNKRVWEVEFRSPSITATTLHKKSYFIDFVNNDST
jgi:hypothetical protein